jgi:hypothetical protein
VTGSVVQVITPAEMPDIEELGTALSHEARRIVTDWGVERLAVLSHQLIDRQGRVQEVWFVALFLGGGWWDLQRQPITIEPYYGAVS